MEKQYLFFFFLISAHRYLGTPKPLTVSFIIRTRKQIKKTQKLGEHFFFWVVYFWGGGCCLFVCLGKNLDVNHTLLRTCCLSLADSNHPTLLFFERCYCNRHYSREFGKHSKLREMLLHLLALACSLDLQSHDVSFFFFYLFFFPLLLL